MTDTEAPKPARRVLGIFAHPDDPEFFCGGTFARWTASGAEVTFVIATSGDKGSAEPDMTHERLIEIREAEERAAAAVLGVKEVVFLRYPDGELVPSIALRRDLTRQIRLHQPDIVVTNDPTAFWYGTTTINHPDHRAIGQAALEAVFPAARDRLNFFELARDEGLLPHKARYVYIALPVQRTTSVDITDHIETKVAALREHKSQISDMDGLLARVRERNLDPEAPDDVPRYIEHFRVITLS